MTPALDNPARRGCRRGSIYLATLGTAVIVTIIGLSALLVARVHRATAAAVEDATRARIAADCAVDVMIFRLAGQSDWRDVLENDVWTSEEIAGDATVSYKLVDEIDGDLSNDDTQPVRLYAKARVGRAVRICSVLLNPPDWDNILTNGDMESGTAGWSGQGLCDLLSTSTSPHGGNACLYVRDRTSSSAGPVQDVTSSLQNGKAYGVEVWVKMSSCFEYVRVSLNVVSSGSGSQSFSFSAPGETGWTRVAGSLTPTWSGTLDSATLSVTTFWSTQRFYIDDATVILLQSPPMRPVPGTWRKEVLP